jgi:UDP-glucuronate 4-epimerase
LSWKVYSLRGEVNILAILVTGAAGFIGYHLSQKLLSEGHSVIGLDNLNDYYDVSLKQNRLLQLEGQDAFTFYKISLENREELEALFQAHRIKTIIHLAAQAGVRYSLINPHAYIQSNLVGFTNLLEACRLFTIDHFIYASSSSVYGANTKMPFSTQDPVNHPVSLYAATKRSNELLAHTYSHLFGIPTTGLRFFTVYGAWGRPDMAYFTFTSDIYEGKTIQVYNHGNMLRDFTYIDDVVEGLVRLIDHIPQPNEKWDRDHPNPSTSYAPYRLFNIGNHQPVQLSKFISIIQDLVGKKALIEYLPMQPGDVPSTYADVQDLQEAVGFKPATNIEKGLEVFVNWYKNYYVHPI